MVIKLTNRLNSFDKRNMKLFSTLWNWKKNILLTGYIMTEREELGFSNKAEKEKQVFEAFNDFNQWYIDSGGKSAELTDIIHRILNKAYPPLWSKLIKKALPMEESRKQLPLKQSATLAKLKEYQPARVQHLTDSLKLCWLVRLH